MWSSRSHPQANGARPPSSPSVGRFSSVSGARCLAMRSVACTRCARLPRSSEMFDLRYHVASLAAVFLALIIGILVGVGISDRGLVDKGKSKLLEDQVASLQRRLDATAQQSTSRTRERMAAQSFISEAYPA